MSINVRKGKKIYRNSKKKIQVHACIDLKIV